MSVGRCVSGWPGFWGAVNLAAVMAEKVEPAAGGASDVAGTAGIAGTSDATGTASGCGAWEAAAAAAARVGTEQLSLADLRSALSLPDVKAAVSDVMIECGMVENLVAVAAAAAAVRWQQPGTVSKDGGGCGSDSAQGVGTAATWGPCDGAGAGAAPPAQALAVVCDSLWVMTNFATGAVKNTQALLDAGAVPPLLGLLHSQPSDIVKQAVRAWRGGCRAVRCVCVAVVSRRVCLCVCVCRVQLWTLGNIAGDSCGREALLAADALPAIVECLCRTVAAGKDDEVTDRKPWSPPTATGSVPPAHRLLTTPVAPQASVAGAGAGAGAGASIRAAASAAAIVDVDVADSPVGDDAPSFPRGKADVGAAKRLLLASH